MPSSAKQAIIIIIVINCIINSWLGAEILDEHLTATHTSQTPNQTYDVSFLPSLSRDLRIPIYLSVPKSLAIRSFVDIIPNCYMAVMIRVDTHNRTSHTHNQGHQSFPGTYTHAHYKYTPNSFTLMTLYALTSFILSVYVFGSDHVTNKESTERSSPKSAVTNKTCTH